MRDLLSKGISSDRRLSIDKVVGTLVEQMSKDLFGYVSHFPGEPNLTDFFDDQLEYRDVYLPCLEGDRIIFRRLEPGWKGHLQTGNFTIPEYRAGAIAQEYVGCILVPGLAFSHQGIRLGRGKGLYDRFLSGPGASLTKVGVGWSFQVVSDLPEESHDVRMDYLCTEQGIINCHSGSTAS
jgi:5-formyltetrahydrofolate cyclo-ligase